MIISWKALERTTKQTDILVRQFELAELARKESTALDGRNLKISATG
jgi:hypothetical protein